MTVLDYKLIMGREDKVKIYKHTNYDMDNPDYQGILVRQTLRSCPFAYSKIQSVIVVPEIATVGAAQIELNMIHYIFLE